MMPIRNQNWNEHIHAVNRNKIFQVLTDPKFDGATQRQVAKAAGLNVKTVRKHLSGDFWAEIRAERLRVMYRTLAEGVQNLDRMILDMALAGNLQAAKLLYARWEHCQKYQGSAQEAELPEDIAALEAQVATLLDEANHDAA